MKTIITYLVFLAGSLIFINCSGDDEFPGTVIPNPNSEDIDIPVQEVPVNENAIEIKGFPRFIKKYQYGSLEYWAQYYYNPDGNVIQVIYGYAENDSGTHSDTYEYNAEGKLINLYGHDVYHFYWDNERIVAADKYNGMWNGHSRILYEYNTEGQLIQKTENYIDLQFIDRTTYSYFDDGNLKMIVQFYKDVDTDDFESYFVTTISGYTEDQNLFPELTIIPGQRVQSQFPASMDFKHLFSSDYDRHEIYRYEYDTEGRVVEKISSYSKVMYQYY